MLPIFWVTEYASGMALVVLSRVESMACIDNTTTNHLNLLWCVQGHFLVFRKFCFSHCFMDFFNAGVVSLTVSRWAPIAPSQPHTLYYTFVPSVTSS